MQIDTGIMTADLRAVARQAAEAEAMGYDGVWTAEAGHDPYLPCVSAATATERVTKALTSASSARRMAMWR